MKNNNLVSGSIIFIFLMFSSATLAQVAYHHEKDSLLRVISSLTGGERLNAYYQLMLSVYHNEENMDSVQVYFNDYIQEAQSQNNLKEEGMVYVNLLAAYCNREQMKDAIQQAPHILKFLGKNELWEYYYQAYAIFLEACFFDKQYQKTIDKAKELYQLAKKQGNDNGISAAFYSMALVYHKTGRVREAGEYFRKCIEIQQKTDDKTSLLTQSYYYLFEIVSAEKRSDEALQLILDWKKAIKDYETRKKLENPIAWGQVYAAYAQIYFDKNQLFEAEAYCDSSLMICSDPSNSANISFLKALILTSKKEYPQALKLLDEAYETFSAYNEWDVTVEIMRAKMQILLRGEDNKEALSLFETILARKDSLSNQEFHAQLDELRTQYEVDTHIAEKEKARSYMYFAFAGCILLIITLGMWIYYNHQITKKNKALVKQIKEIQTQQTKDEIELLNKTAFETEDVDDELCPEKRKDQLCIAIRDMLHKEKAYRDQTITRDNIVERLGTNKELFIDAFQYCFGMSFSEYVNSLRLKDSITLLEESDLSIEEISEKAGFGTVRTFQRQFQAKYNMSPKEYRKAAMK